jgi:hypothetical protein
MRWPGSMRGGGRKALFQGRRDIDHGRSAGFGGGCDFFALPLGFNERLEPFFKIVVVLFGTRDCGYPHFAQPLKM